MSKIVTIMFRCTVHAFVDEPTFARRTKMKSIYEDVKSFWKQKTFIWPLVLTAIFSYGFLIINPTIGIDDTASERFFQDGLEPYMGRWVLFLINKIFHFAEFAPFLTELVAVIFFCISVTLWCAVFKRVLKDELKIIGYTIFACVFISSPILSEILTYYTHNGICMAYGIAAIAVLAFQEGIKRGKKCTCRYILLSSLFITIAAGCYESMIFVYVTGVILVYILLCVSDKKQNYCMNLLGWLVRGTVAIVLFWISRSVIVESIKLIFQLEDNIVALPTRSITEVEQWINGELHAADFIMLCKRFFLKYYINAICYLPVAVFVTAIIILILGGGMLCVQYKEPRILLCVTAVLILPVVLLIIEGETTPYRASQYIPLICAFSALLLFVLIETFASGKWKKMIQSMATFLLIVCVYNQCTEMNKWFYVDYLKYEDAKNVINTIAYELEKNYDVSKPVIFVGRYEIPHSIVEGACLELNSEDFFKVRKLADKLDEHLKEKYYQNGYYCFAETPFLSVLKWGVDAFDSTNIELFNFLEMHGHSFVMEKELEKYREAREYTGTMPVWPRDGYIRETENYIVVKLGN